MLSPTKSERSVMEYPERRPTITRYSFMLHLMIKTRFAVSTKPVPAKPAAPAAPVGFALSEDENAMPAVPILLAELTVSALLLEPAG